MWNNMFKAAYRVTKTNMEIRKNGKKIYVYIDFLNPLKHERVMKTFGDYQPIHEMDWMHTITIHRKE